MGTTDSIRVEKIYYKKYYKMKISCALLATVALADNKKVPPRHPLQRLQRLTEFSEELLNEWYDFLPSKDNWINKFATNAKRMEKNFERGNQRCGFYDESQLPHGGPEPTTTTTSTTTTTTTTTEAPTTTTEKPKKKGNKGNKKKGNKGRSRRDIDADERYDREDPAVGTKQITTGFAKWADRYLSRCSGQKNYQFQANRMEKWNNKLQAHLARNAEGSGSEE